MNCKKVLGGLGIICMIAFVGCSSNNSSTSDAPKIGAMSSSGVENITLDTDDMFTDRDKDTSYEDATEIVLDDSTTETTTISKEGTYLLTGSLSNGQIVVDVDKKEKVQLVLKDVTINCDTSAAIYVKQADKVFITLEGENTLSNSQEFVAIDDNNIDGVIFSKDDLTFNGSGSLTVTAKYGHGIVSKNDLVFTSGTYTVEAASHALSGKDSVRIAGGTYNLTAGKDAIHSKNTDDTTKGYVYIEDGNFTINADDDGIHANMTNMIAGGTITIEKSYEGIEGQDIEITGGTITVTSSDDGLNAASAKTESTDSDSESEDSPKRNTMEADDNCLITISGGKLSINADGDGIDSNGNLVVTGGETYVEGPTNGGNGALDYGGTAKITGGIVVAVGASGMAQNFGSDSTQGAMLVDFQNQVSGEVVLKDSDGNSIISYTSEKTYNSVVISTPEVKKGSTYTLTAGSESQTVEMTDIIYGEGFSMGGQGGGGFNKGDFKKDDSSKGDFKKDDSDKGNFDPKNKGELESAPQGEMETPPQGEMGSAPQGEMETPPQGEMGTQPQSEEGTQSQSKDETQSQSEQESVPVTGGEAM
jgi:hypothetical protein